MITLPGEVDGHRVRVGCDVVAIEDVQDSLAAFGDRYLRKVFTASEINDCQGRNRVHRLAARFAAKEAVIKAFAEPDMRVVRAFWRGCTGESGCGAAALRGLDGAGQDEQVGVDVLR
jgi:hypothetical protein